MARNENNNGTTTTAAPEDQNPYAPPIPAPDPAEAEAAQREQALNPTSDEVMPRSHADRAAAGPGDGGAYSDPRPGALTTVEDGPLSEAQLNRRMLANDKGEQVMATREEYEGGLKFLGYHPLDHDDPWVKTAQAKQ